ncbi:hypothetical protein GCM10023195_77460 [Actinoallomurus liliacearum]|uniref:Uncharacterized protein n=2 Tax=Actinoallomurus liliacearum TaxID=1080073 RepID=A0ABP8TVB6_9ACTN
MSAAPFGPHPVSDSPEDTPAGTCPICLRPAGPGWESELARLRREMPMFGFLFDGRYWWGVYGSLVIVSASDPESLRERFPEAVRTALQNACRNRHGNQ